MVQQPQTQTHRKYEMGKVNNSGDDNNWNYKYITITLTWIGQLAAQTQCWHLALLLWMPIPRVI